MNKMNLYMRAVYYLMLNIKPKKDKQCRLTAMKKEYHKKHKVRDLLSKSILWDRQNNEN